ncbi:MAG: hypothetical protein HY548_02325 [Elusimicrobia bacterium]|nr:hypothetical protein [Elusimicrobiota bacterium]
MINSSHSSRATLFLLAASLAAGPLAADVTVSRLIKSGGFRGMGASETQTTEHYQGTNRRQDSTIKFTGALMGRMAGGDSVEITKVAEDKAYTLNPPKKSYRERTLSEAAQMMKKEGGPARQEKESKPTHRITKTDFKVDPTGEKKTINGFPCERYVVTMLVEAENIENKQKTQTRLVTNNWTTPETPALKTLQQEERTFNEAYLKKLGWDMSPRDAQQFGETGMAMMMGVDEKEMNPKMAELKKEMSKMKGVPVAMEIKWFIESDEAAKAMREAQKEAAAQRPPEAEDEGVDVSGGPSGILGGMAAKFAKNKMKASAEKKAEAKDDESSFSSYMEIREIKTGAVPADLFQVPAGYKLEK